MQTKLKRNDFLFLKQKGNRYKGRYFIVLYSKDQDQFSWGVVASKKVGKAVTRNYYKRITRETIRLIEKTYTFLGLRAMIICLPKQKTSFNDYYKDLLYILKKINALVNSPKHL